MIVPAQTSDERIALVAYMASKMGSTPEAIVGQAPFEVVAVVNQGKPCGAVLYTNYRESFIEMACAGEPGWLTKANLRSLFYYPFVQLGCYTVITTFKRRHPTSRKFNEKLGFVTLGVIESGISRGEDTILNTMTRPQCRWLEQSEIATSRPALAIGAYAHG